MPDRQEEDSPRGPAGRAEDGKGRGDAWERLAPGVVRRRLPRWDATVGAVRGTSGVLVVDTGSCAEEGARIRAEAEDLFGLPVTDVVLTHAHFDHVLGTSAFGTARVHAASGMDTWLADAGAREALREDAVRHGLPPADAAGAVAALVPAQHVITGRRAATGALAAAPGGRRPVLAHLGPAHSAHDLAVLVPGAPGAPDVVFCGDLVEESGPPQAGPDARPARWPGALDGLLSLGGEDALYVPGHGAVVDAGFVRGQRDELAARFGVSP